MLSVVTGHAFTIYFFTVPLLLHWIWKFFGLPIVVFMKYLVLSLLFLLGMTIVGFCGLLFIYRDLYE